MKNILDPARSQPEAVCQAVPGPCTPLAGLDVRREGMGSFHVAVGHMTAAWTLHNLEGGLTLTL